MDTFVHFLDSDSREFKNPESVAFDSRLPIVGEYIIMPDNDKCYEVKFIFHTPASDEYSAEIYAIETTVTPQSCAIALLNAH